MSATDTTTLAGTWQLDPVHSRAGFAVNYDNPDFEGHVMAPDFCEVDKHPTVTFTSSPFGRTGDEVVIAFAAETRIDRTAFGLNWNAPLPKGGFALADEVRLTLDHAFVKAQP